MTFVGIIRKYVILQQYCTTFDGWTTETGQKAK